MEKYFIDKLNKLLYQTVTIYTINALGQNNKIIGVISAVNDDYITVVMSIGTSLPTPEKCKINFNRRYKRSTSINNLLIPGVIAEIPLKSITSVIHYAI